MRWLNHSPVNASFHHRPCCCPPTAPTASQEAPAAAVVPTRLSTWQNLQDSTHNSTTTKADAISQGLAAAFSRDGVAGQVQLGQTQAHRTTCLDRSKQAVAACTRTPRAACYWLHCVEQTPSGEVVQQPETTGIRLRVSTLLLNRGMRL